MGTARQCRDSKAGAEHCLHFVVTCNSTASRGRLTARKCVFMGQPLGAGVERCNCITYQILYFGKVET